MAGDYTVGDLVAAFFIACGVTTVFDRDRRVPRLVSGQSARRVMVPS